MMIAGVTHKEEESPCFLNRHISPFSLMRYCVVSIDNDVVLRLSLRKVLASTTQQLFSACLGSPLNVQPDFIRRLEFSLTSCYVALPQKITSPEYIQRVDSGSRARGYCSTCLGETPEAAFSMVAMADIKPSFFSQQHSLK